MESTVIMLSSVVYKIDVRLKLQGLCTHSYTSNMYKQRMQTTIDSAYHITIFTILSGHYNSFFCPIS